MKRIKRTIHVSAYMADRLLKSPRERKEEFSCPWSPLNAYRPLDLCPKMESAGQCPERALLVPLLEDTQRRKGCAGAGRTIILYQQNHKAAGIGLFTRRA